MCVRNISPVLSSMRPHPASTDTLSTKRSRIHAHEQACSHVYASMRSHTHARAHARAHARNLSACRHAWMHECARAGAHTRTQKCIRTHMQLCTHGHTQVRTRPRTSMRTRTCGVQTLGHRQDGAGYKKGCLKKAVVAAGRPRRSCLRGHSALAQRRRPGGATEEVRGRGRGDGSYGHVQRCRPRHIAGRVQGDRRAMGWGVGGQGATW